jgi:glycosyltransferase involved in cell wall biosynthesis
MKANNRKRILILSSRLPYPPIGGDRLKNYWLLKILSKHFDVHLVSITEKNIPKEFYNWVNELGITHKLFPKSKREHILSTLRSVWNREPLQVNYFYFKDIQKYIDEIYSEFDILFATLIRTAKYVATKQKPKILEMTDLISLNYERSKQKTASLFWKIIYNIESFRLKQFEITCAKLFNRVLLVNKEEVEILKNYTSLDNSIIFLPNGVDEYLLSYNRTNPKYKNCISFFGKMDYQPNIDAVLWFVNNVLKYLNKNIKFCIVGANPTKEIKNLEKKFNNIIVTGFVKDPYEILKSSLCVVAPMQTGAGIQNKVLEAMALGTKVILSSLAAKPIGAIHGRDYLVIDDPLEMAKAINDIYKNQQLYNHLIENSRKFIKENFTWSIYERKLLEVIEEVLK